MLNKKFLTLFGFYLSYAWFTDFSLSVLPTHFLAQHLDLKQILIGVLFGLFGQLTMLLIFKKFRSRLSWRLALICVLAYVLLVISIRNDLQFYAASFIDGCSLYFFFVFYNIIHFKNTPKETRGHSASLMFSIPALIGIVAPILAGYVIKTNILFLWIISIMSFLVSLYLVNLQENFEVSYSIKKAVEEIRATRILIFIEGVWEALLFGIIPVYTLFFIKSPLGYGAFLSYLAIIGIIANLILGKLSDRLQKRIIFLYPLTICMAIVTILFIFTKSNITTWIILTSVIQFFVPLFWSTSTAMVIDSHSNLELAIPGRELMLVTGRITGAVLAVGSFMIERQPYYIFIILGLILFCYPAVLFWNSKITKKHEYL